MEDTVYKINIYTIVEESSDVHIESKELHEKVVPFRLSTDIYFLSVAGHLHGWCPQHVHRGDG